jgi:1,4-alpha-glucan branching enzyme
MPGDEWRRFASLRSLLAFMWAHPGKQLLFMGSEWGQGSEWSADNGLDWWVLDFDVHQGVQKLSRDLNAIYKQTPALWQLDTSPEGFSWIDANDAPGNTLSFLRFGAAPGTASPGAQVATQASPDGMIACVANFSAAPHLDYKIGLPQAGRWREILNTDAAIYGGSGVGNLGGIEAVEEPWHGRPASATITLPPLGVLWLTPETVEAPEVSEVSGVAESSAEISESLGAAGVLEDTGTLETTAEDDGAPAASPEPS